MLGEPNILFMTSLLYEKCEQKFEKEKKMRSFLGQLLPAFLKKRCQGCKNRCGDGSCKKKKGCQKSFGDVSQKNCMD